MTIFTLYNQDKYMYTVLIIGTLLIIAMLRAFVFINLVIKTVHLPVLRWFNTY